MHQIVPLLLCTLVVSSNLKALTLEGHRVDVGGKERPTLLQEAISAATQGKPMNLAGR